MGGVPNAPESLEKPDFSSSSEMSSIQRRGGVRIAVMDNQPGLCSPSTSGRLEGFEVDLSLLLAQALFGGTLDQARQNVEFVEVALPARSDVIQAGEVDLVVANYADTADRREVADFAGHYMFTPNAPLTGQNCPDIVDASSLNGLRVAVTPNSVQGELVPEIAPHAELVEYGGLGECLQAVKDGSVEVFFSDVVSNKGYVRYVDPSFGTPTIRCPGERWGVGLRKGAKELGTLVDDTVRRAFESGALNQSLRRWIG